jgi:hypothetical protein
MHPGHDTRRELAQAVVTNGWGLLQLSPAGLSLEEIFLKLTTREAIHEGEDSAPEPVAAGGEMR